MKKTELKKLHQKTVDQLQELLKETLIKLAKARLQLRAAKLDDINLPSKLADDVARIKTIMREKQLMRKAKEEIADKEEK
ncbi:MAG: uL29 family ribosomal protein [Patescibacteria group bacterium]|nr:uL29 family ribosomal protein [Patescibacteria group bacterium]